MSYGDLLRECAAHLPSADYEELDAATSQPPSGKTTFARAWKTAYLDWHAFNVTERHKRLPGEQNASPAPPAIASDQLRNDLQNAWQAADPLLREQSLLRALWQWIETRRRQAPFSLDDLIGYALQLQILARREHWNDAAGQTLFQEHTQSFLQPVIEELRNQELSA